MALSRARARERAILEQPSHTFGQSGAIACFLFLFISDTSQLKHQFVVIVVVPELRVLRRGCQQGPLEPSMQGLSNLSMQPRRASICR